MKHKLHGLDFGVGGRRPEVLKLGEVEKPWGSRSSTYRWV